jgi:small subunit ribosomal protein S3Ae
MARRVTTKDKWKQKSWYTILAPKEFGEKEVGETPANESKDVVGRRIGVPANEVTTGKRLNHVKLTFEVESVNGKNAKTKLTNYEVVRSFIRSIVRRRRKRVDFVKDYEVEGRKIRVKAIAMTAGKCYATQLKNIRQTMREIIDESVQSKSINDIITSTLNREIQDEIKEKAKKVFPISSVEIRKIEILN